MELAPGLRLTPDETTAYEISRPARTTAGCVYYGAKKVFRNYRDRDRALYEADPDEWLDVLVRAPRAGDPGALRRALDFELDQVLGRPDLPGLPEPIDVLDGPGGVPLLVLADPHGAALGDALPAAPLPHLVRLTRELLDLLTALDGLGAVGDLDPASIQLDADGRWTVLGPMRPADPSGPAAHLRGWCALARPIAARLAPPDDPAASWLRDALRRADSGAATAADLLRPDPLWRRAGSALRRALGSRRAEP